MLNRKISLLLVGSNGTGVGRAEAAELARRFGDEHSAVKNNGEWFIVVRAEYDADPEAPVDAWSVQQVADFLWKCERGLSPARPRASYVLRAFAREGSS